jgi:GT2 family glycosyltransferase
MTVKILALNYNGKSLLERFIPSLLAAAACSKHAVSVGVVDNCSSDGSVSFLKEHFPQVSVIESRKNDIVCSFNEALKEIEEEIVILLNNDIQTKDDFVDFLVGHFNDQEVFFVAPRILNFDNTFNGGRSFLTFKFGILQNIVDYQNASLPGVTHSIGTGAFRRLELLRLGGFDKIYLPGVWEEVDLCYRALLEGRKGVYEPRSIIWHEESTTFNKVFGSKRKLIFAHRNMFLFIWKNITDKGLLFQSLIFIFPRLIYSFLSGKTEFAFGFMQALPFLPRVLKIRFELKRQAGARKLKDRDIIR